jgi:23S rRNA pseudouridine1911/1915/1917 synthase
LHAVREPLDILYQDNHLLVVDKPAGLVTQGAEAGVASLYNWAADYLKHAGRKPGQAYVGIVSRLDAGTSGVVVLAKTSKAAARLSAQFRDGAVEKTYWAVVGGCFQGEPIELVHDLCPDTDGFGVRVCHAETPGAKRCRLSVRRLSSDGRRSLLEVQPQTGRKHQIRAQLSAAGFPILGDRRYGSPSPWPQGIALHARSITFAHPTRREPMTILAPAPRSWHEQCGDWALFFDGGRLP